MRATHVCSLGVLLLSVAVAVASSSSSVFQQSVNIEVQQFLNTEFNFAQMSFGLSSFTEGESFLGDSRYIISESFRPASGKALNSSSFVFVKQDLKTNDTGSVLSAVYAPAPEVSSESFHLAYQTFFPLYPSAEAGEKNVFVAAYAEGNPIIGLTGGLLVAYDCDSGKQLWNKSNAAPLPAIKPHFSPVDGTGAVLYASPLISDKIFALNPLTGESLWTKDLPSGVIIGALATAGISAQNISTFAAQVRVLDNKEEEGDSKKSSLRTATQSTMEWSNGVKLISISISGEILCVTPTVNYLDYNTVRGAGALALSYRSVESVSSYLMNMKTCTVVVNDTNGVAGTDNFWTVPGEEDVYYVNQLSENINITRFSGSTGDQMWETPVPFSGNYIFIIDAAFGNSGVNPETLHVALNGGFFFALKKDDGAINWLGNTSGSGIPYAPTTGLGARQVFYPVSPGKQMQMVIIPNLQGWTLSKMNPSNQASAPTTFATEEVNLQEPIIGLGSFATPPGQNYVLIAGRGAGDISVVTLKLSTP